MGLVELRAKIADRTAIIGVIGLGYVGLPVACAFAEAGFPVIGVERKLDRIEQINRGQSPIEGREPGLAELLAEVVAAGRLRATAQYAELAAADIVLIDVETPVADDRHPRFEALRAALSALAPVLKAEALVIVESTIAPGTMDRLVAPLLQALTGRALNTGFYMGHCPERVMPGRLLANLRQVSRVCGGSTPETAEVMAALYRTIVHADLDPADCVTAELAKTAENAYRDVNIAFANELALVCEVTGGDFQRVRELVNKSPGRNVLLAGAGVGGHCITKDPWLLAYGAEGRVPLHLIPAARDVNDAMPVHMARLTVAALRAAGREVAGARIAILGYAYLENSDDTRNSPSEVLAVRLREMAAQIVIHDPWVPAYTGDLWHCLRGCDAAVIMVRHDAYLRLDLAALKAALRTPVLVDGRHVVAPAAAQAAGLVFRTVGRG